jgi:hypothetical protein
MATPARKGRNTDSMGRVFCRYDMSIPNINPDMARASIITRELSKYQVTRSQVLSLFLLYPCPLGL